MKNNVLYVLLCLMALQGSMSLVAAEASRSCFKENPVYRNMRWLYGACFALENFNALDDTHVKERNIRKKSKRSKSQAKRMHLSQGLIEFDNGENYIFVEDTLLNKECISDWYCLQKCFPGTHCCSKFWCCQCKCTSKKIPTRAEAFQAEEAFYKQRRAREKELQQKRAQKDAALAQAALVAKDRSHAPAAQMMDAPISGPAVPTSLAAAAVLTPVLSSAHAKKDSQQKSVSFALPLQKTDSGTQTSPLGPVSLPGSLEEVDAMPDAQPQQKQLRVATDSAVFFVPQGSSPAARKLPALPVVPKLPLVTAPVTPSQGQHGSPAHSFRLPHFNGGFTFTFGGKSVYEVTPAGTPAHHSKQSPAHAPLSGHQAITIRVGEGDVLTVEKHKSKPSRSLTVSEPLPGVVEQAEPERPKSAASQASLLSEVSEA